MAIESYGKGLATKPKGNEAMESAQANQLPIWQQAPSYPMPSPQLNSGVPQQTTGNTTMLSPYQQVYNPTTGQATSTNAAPNVQTTQYQTGVGSGTAGQPGYTPPATNVSGQGTLSQGSYEQQQQDQLRAQLSQQAFANRLALLSPYTGSPNSSAHVDYGMTPDETAARQAAFARAKEQAGQTGLAAMRGLQDSMASRGLSGSLGRGLEGGGINNIIGQTAGGVNDFTREQLIQDLNRYSNIANKKYEGDIQQRGQDLSSRSAILGLLGAGGLF